MEVCLNVVECMRLISIFDSWRSETATWRQDLMLSGGSKSKSESVQWHEREILFEHPRGECFASSKRRSP